MDERCPCCGQMGPPRDATDNTRDSGLVPIPEDVRAEIKAILERKDIQRERAPKLKERRVY